MPSITTYPTAATLLSSVANLASSNNSYATYTSPNTQKYNFDCTAFDFSSLPDGSIITGFELLVEAKEAGLAGTTTLYEGDARIIVNGSTVGTSPTNATTITLTTSDASNSCGADGDLWGTSGISASDMKLSNSGVRVVISIGISERVDIDYISLKIYYLPPSSGLFFGSNF